MNPQPASLAGGVRELVEDLRQKAMFNESQRTQNTLQWRAVAFEQKRISDELSALLKQRSVAEPQISVPMREWLQAKRVELSAEQLWAVESYLVMNVLPIAPAHAAEQPKLTEPFRTEHLEVLLSGRFGISSVTGAADLAWLADQLNKLRSLLTSPVASPPPKKEEIMKSADLMQTTDHVIWAREFVQRYGGDEELMASWFASAMMAMHDKMHGPPNGDAMQYKLDQQTPPVAPGEQPPQLIGQPLPVPASHGTKFGFNYQPLNAPEVVSVELPPAPPAQQSGGDSNVELSSCNNAGDGPIHVPQMFVPPPAQERESYELLSDLTIAVGCIILWCNREIGDLDRDGYLSEAKQKLQSIKRKLAAQPSPQTKEDVK